MKAMTPWMVDSAIVRPPITTGLTARGWTMRTSSRRACAARIMSRIILMPPPVEPAQVAKQPSSTISSEANSGHCA